jgi:hypothetical protein
MEVNDQFHAFAALNMREIILGTHRIGGWVGPRSCGEEKSFYLFKEWNLDYSALQPVTVPAKLLTVRIYGYVWICASSREFLSFIHIQCLRFHTSDSCPVNANVFI